MALDAPVRQQAMSNLLRQQSMVKMAKTFCSFYLFLVDFKINLSIISADHKSLTLKQGFSNALLRQCT